MTEVDEELAGQFVVDSLGAFDYYPYTDFSEDTLIEFTQSQYQHYCLMVKAQLSMSITGDTNPIMDALKKHIKSYVSNSTNRYNKAMRYLYEGTEKTVLIHQISMLAFHANIRNVKDINNLSTQEIRAAIDPEIVSLALGLYVYFTILVNESISAKDFNELFVEAWINYFEYTQARILMFQMRGDMWKNDFEGVLLND